MSIERATKTVEVAGGKVTVKELTVAELERWVEQVADPQAPIETSVVRGGIIKGLSLRDIALMSNITVDEMVNLTPSQVQVISDACVELNRNFFALLDRLEKIEAKSSAGGASSTPSS